MVLYITNFDACWQVMLNLSSLPSQQFLKIRYFCAICSNFRIKILQCDRLVSLKKRSKLITSHDKGYCKIKKFFFIYNLLMILKFYKIWKIKLERLHLQIFAHDILLTKGFNNWNTNFQHLIFLIL